MQAADGTNEFRKPSEFYQELSKAAALKNRVTLGQGGNAVKTSAIGDSRNGPAFLKHPAYQKWMEQVVSLPPDKQVDAVARRLQELNPEFDGNVTRKIENFAVTELEFSTDNVTDISPVRALTGLHKLSCRGSFYKKGRLADLSPLSGLPLKVLTFDHTQVTDLSPVKGMLLTSMSCSACPVSSVAPLSGMASLRDLDLAHSAVSDLSPLKGLKLTILHCTGVSNLEPLQGMSLKRFSCCFCDISDISVLKGMPLEFLNIDSSQVSDLTPLKGMSSLTVIMFHRTRVSDLAPLMGMKSLTSVICYGAPISDLSPLKALRLKDIECDFKPERDTEILRAIETLETINKKPAAEFWKEVETQPVKVPKNPKPSSPAEKSTNPTENPGKKEGAARQWKRGPKEGQLHGLIPRPAVLDGVQRWQLHSRWPFRSVASLSWSKQNAIACTCEGESEVRVYNGKSRELTQVPAQSPAIIFAAAWNHAGDELVAVGQGTGPAS